MRCRPSNPASIRIALVIGCGTAGFLVGGIWAGVAAAALAPVGVVFVRSLRPPSP